MEYLTFWVSLVLLRTKAGLRDGDPMEVWGRNGVLHPQN